MNVLKCSHNLVGSRGGSRYVSWLGGGFNNLYAQSVLESFDGAQQPASFPFSMLLLFDFLRRSDFGVDSGAVWPSVVGRSLRASGEL